MWILLICKFYSSCLLNFEVATKCGLPELFTMYRLSLLLSTASGKLLRVSLKLSLLLILRPIEMPQIQPFVSTATDFDNA